MEGRIENNGNQEKGKEEKEALRKFSTRQKGTRIASPKFLNGIFLEPGPASSYGFGALAAL
jgi:hypothetical protein